MDLKDMILVMENYKGKGIMELAAEHGISINDESRGYEPALISFEEDNAG